MEFLFHWKWSESELVEKNIYVDVRFRLFIYSLSSSQYFNNCVEIKLNAIIINYVK